jgi:hypothetical protein
VLPEGSEAHRRRRDTYFPQQWPYGDPHADAGRQRCLTIRHSVVEKAFQVRATLDYDSRPLLQPTIYPFKDWRPDLHMQALLQGEFVRSVPKLRVPY